MNKLYRNISLTVLASLIMTGCQESDSQSAIAQQTASQPLTATAIIVSQDSMSVTPPSIRSMWQYKLQFMAPENKAVKKGEVIIRFDAQQLRNDLISKQSQLNAALKEREQERLQQEQREQDLTLSLAEAKKNLDKEQRKAEIVDLSISGIEKAKQKKQFEIAQVQFTQVQQRIDNFNKSKEINAEVAQSKISRLQSDVARIKADIQKLNVKAPKDGVVMYVADHKGEKKAVGESVYQGQSLMTIPSLDNIAIEAQFDEPDLNKVTLGRVVKVTLDAFPELPYMGKITALGQAFKNKSRQNQRKVFDVYITLDTIDPEVMRPGMQGKVELVKTLDASAMDESAMKTSVEITNKSKNKTKTEALN